MAFRKRKIKLTGEEKEIERASERGDYVPVSDAELADIARAIEARKKDTVLHIRINRNDLEILKKKASSLGVKYQTFISEILHHIARS